MLIQMSTFRKQISRRHDCSYKDVTNIIEAFESLAQPFDGELRVKESTLRNVSLELGSRESAENEYEDARFPIPSKFIDHRN